MNASQDGYRDDRSKVYRIEKACPSCRYYGVCSGFFMAEATPEQRYLDELGHLRCGIAQSVQQYVEQILIDAGLVDSRHDSLLIDKIKSRVSENRQDIF